MLDYLTKATDHKPVGELDVDIWTSPNHPDEIPAPPAHLQHAWRGRQATRGLGPKPGRFGVLEAECL